DDLVTGVQTCALPISREHGRRGCEQLDDRHRAAFSLEGSERVDTTMTVIELLASSPAVFTGTCLVLGLVVGSFLNVVIYRLPVRSEERRGGKVGRGGG